MAFNLKTKDFKIRTTIPFTAGEKYQAVVTDVAVVKGVKDPSNEYLRITLKVEDHEELQLFGTLYDAIDENGYARASLLKKIAKQLSEEMVSNSTFDVVEYLSKLEASSHTDEPKTIGVYVLPRKDSNYCYLSAKAYASAVEWFAQQDEEADTDFSVLG